MIKPPITVARYSTISIQSPFLEVFKAKWDKTPNNLPQPQSSPRFRQAVEPHIS